MQYNALQSLQAFEMGQGQRKQREYDDGRKKLGNALAGGDYAGGAATAFGMGDIETGMALQGQQKSMLDAQAEERRNAMLSAVMSLSERAEGEERQAFVPQVLETLRLKGVELSPEMLSQMDLSTGALQATLKALQDPDTLMAQYQKAQEPYTLAPGARRYGPDGREIAANPKPEARFRPLTPEEARSAGLPSNSGYQVNEQTGEIKAVGREAAPQVSINMPGDDSWKFAPPPAGYAYSPDPNAPGGARLVPVQGGPAAAEIASEQEKKDKNLTGTELTVGNLIGSYATLAKNKAITAQGNTAGDNIAAIYSRSPIGKFQDEIGGEVGNLENAEARETIEGLSMNALMKMISMSDISAKAMDSDAEMRNWLTSIKSDNFEAALTKLHVLDISFGNGRALQEAFASGVISQETYQYVTRRVNTDPMTKQMYDRARRYASLGQAIGVDNMTAAEMAELERLEALERGGQ